MPELPEVETVVRRLAEVLPGKTIKQIQVLCDKSFQGKPRLLRAVKVNDISRRAKMIRIHLDDEHDLLVHLKMTGQLIFLDKKTKTGGGHPTDDWVGELPSSHTRVIIDFTDDSTLYFNDMRVFGWVRAMDEASIEEEFAKYGPDANSPAVNAEYFKEVFGHRSVAVKQALMNNQLLSGVGNIYASEALFYAGVHPQRPAKSLSNEEWQKVYRAVKMVLDEGIKAGGTTFDGKYVNADGLAGAYQTKLKVYGQAGEPCQECGTTIEKVQLGGRGTFFCPQCQS